MNESPKMTAAIERDIKEILGRDVKFQNEKKARGEKPDWDPEETPPDRRRRYLNYP